MSIAIANVANTDTFLKLITTVNYLANFASNSAVTVNTGNTVGDASISGAFGANVVYAGNTTGNTYITGSSLSISNSSSNITITIPSNTQIASGQYYLNANGSWSVVATPVQSNTVNTLGTIQQMIDYWPVSTYVAAEYMIAVTDNVANNFHSTKIMMNFSNAGVLSTEYATIISNTNLGTFVGSSNATHAMLLVTPTSTNTTIRYVRTII